jgi:obg-like ATPase 1
MSERDYVRRKNKWLAKIKQWVDEHSSAPSEDPYDFYSKPPIIPFSCKLESHLSVTTDAEEKEKYLKLMAESFGEPGKDGKVAEVKSILPKIVTTGYQALQLVYFFTAGSDEVRAWTLRKGTKAPQAAGVM